MARIQDLFKGYSGAYGTYVIPKDAQPTEKGKRKGEAHTIRQPVTDKLWADHLSGLQGLGIIPINEQDECVWGCVDIDVYMDFDAHDIWKKVKELGIPLTVCRSKSGGAHVYALFSEPVPAEKVRNWLKQVAAALGHAQCEIFPKQIHLGDENLGNWVNMPYMAGSADSWTTRFAYHPETGEGMMLSEFEAETEATNPDVFFSFTLEAELEKKSGSNEFSDGPPCLEALCAAGKYPEGSRNCGLMNLAIFRRKAIVDEEKWISQVNKDNHKYMGPGSQGEVNQIIRSISRKNYGYQCNEEPLSSHCNRGLCQTRRYGVADHQSSITGLQKIDSEPPVWIVQVDDQPVRVTTSEMQNQALFQKAVMEQLNMYTLLRKGPDWSKLLDQLFKKMQVIEVPKEATDEGRLSESLEDFILACTPANTPNQIHMGIPIVIEDRTYFRIKDLINYLGDHGYKDIQKNRHWLFSMMHSMDGVIYHENPRRIAGKALRLWSVVTPARVDLGVEPREEVPL